MVAYPLMGLTFFLWTAAVVLLGLHAWGMLMFTMFLLLTIENWGHSFIIFIRMVWVISRTLGHLFCRSVRLWWHTLMCGCEVPAGKVMRRPVHRFNAAAASAGVILSSSESESESEEADAGEGTREGLST